MNLSLEFFSLLISLVSNDMKNQKVIQNLLNVKLNL